MSTLGWIVIAGVLMSALSLVGGFTLLLSESAFGHVVLPLVGFAAGSLLGGAVFHMLPQAIGSGATLGPWGWFAAGFSTFFVLEQYLQWHHCHRPMGQHRPLGTLILVADGLHNLFGGLAVGSAFVVDVRLGVITWLVAAAHEVPQELGDFGILVHAGWRPVRALAYNLASALTFLLGGLLAWSFAERLDAGLLLPFAAGNFVYIAAADLLPELTRAPALAEKLVHSLTFLAGLVLLWLIALAGI